MRVRTIDAWAIRLENRQGFTAFVSSNLTLSAKLDTAAFDTQPPLVNGGFRVTLSIGAYPPSPILLRPLPNSAARGNRSLASDDSD